MQGAGEFRHPGFTLTIGRYPKADRVNCASPEQVRGSRAAHLRTCVAGLCSSVRQPRSGSIPKYRKGGLFADKWRTQEDSNLWPLPSENRVWKERLETIANAN